MSVQWHAVERKMIDEADVRADAWAWWFFEERPTLEERLADGIERSRRRQAENEKILSKE